MSRTYELQQSCPIARTLDVIGDRWTMLVVRDLLRGHTRFNDLLTSCAGISPNLLSDRLKTLEQHELVERVFYSDHPPRAEYRLTEKGQALGPAMRSLFAWGEQYMPRRAPAAASGPGRTSTNP